MGGENRAERSGEVRQYDWPQIYMLALIQVLGLWSIAPLWMCLFVVLITTAKWLFPNAIGGGLRLMLTLAGGAWFLLYFGFNFTVEIAAVFLWLAASLKLLEIKSDKDLKLFVYVMLYVSAVSMLFEQSILHVLLQLLLVMLALSVLLRLHSGQVRWTFTQWRSLCSVLLFALPLVIVLFVFFPRIGPLWTIPVKASSATTGMSDSMSPGDIANLVNSDERVFRASFSGQRPVQSALYWRGLVLDRFDGRRWSRHPKRFVYGSKGRYDLGQNLEAAGDFYQVLLEPHNRLWLYALEGSESMSTHVKRKDMGQFELAVEAIQPVNYRMSYQSPEFLGRTIPTAYLVSGVDRSTSPSERDLQVPVSGNPETRRYMADLRKRVPSDQALLTHLLREFRNKAFSYSLQPPVLGEHFVDEFLFASRTGFCSHFAGSLAYMLRLADIPARVIVGYQGGEAVEGESYLLVREYDAHAWVEAYISGLGWVRVDPTAMVAPNRIEQNLERALAQEGTFLKDNLAAQWRHGFTALTWLSLKMDKLNYQWQKWVINYSQADQYGVFRKLLGEYSLMRVALVFVSVFVLISILLLLRGWLKAEGRNLSGSQKRYLRWLALYSVLGYPRKIGESPRAYVNRMAEKMPPRLYRFALKETDQLEQREYSGDEQRIRQG